MSENRTPREMETRSLSHRPVKWQVPDLLPEPDKQPNYVYRWIRATMLNNDDPRNISARLREGWEPVDISEQPKFRLLASADERFKNNIEIGGLLLCKIPKEFMAQRAAHYARETQAQTDAVDNSLMRQSDPRMPLFNERKSSTSFGKGST